MTSATAISADHHQVLDAFRSTKVLMVVANPSVNPKLGWPLGFWAAELMHPYFEFTEAGFEVTVASPDGGKVEPDALSDPPDPSRWSAGDLVSMGFLNTPQCVALLVKTPKLADLDWSGYDALVVCGGQSPMFTFRENVDLKRAIRTFYESNKVTAVFCHGVAALVDVQLADGSYLISGKTITGFSNVEEEFSDAFVGQQVMPWRLEDVLKRTRSQLRNGGPLQSVLRARRQFDHRPAAILRPQSRTACH